MVAGGATILICSWRNCFTLAFEVRTCFGSKGVVEPCALDVE